MSHSPAAAASTPASSGAQASHPNLNLPPHGATLAGVAETDRVTRSQSKGNNTAKAMAAAPSVAATAASGAADDGFQVVRSNSKNKGKKAKTINVSDEAGSANKPIDVERSGNTAASSQTASVGAAVAPRAFQRAETTAAANPSAPPPLFQDHSLLREMKIDNVRKDVVVLQCARPVQDVVGAAHVRKNGNGAVQVSLPPLAYQTANSRLFLRRALEMQPLKVPLAAPPAVLTSESALKSHMDSLKAPSLTVAVFGTTKISIVPPRSGSSSFALVLTYPNTVYGQAALAALQKAKEEWPQSLNNSTCPFTSVSFGRERYMCGALRRWPLHLGVAPTDAELDSIRQEVGAPDVHLLPSTRELCFEGEVKFAVPARFASQLSHLKGKYSSLKIYKKVAPPQQVCSKCWCSGHTKTGCGGAVQLCKHCKSPEHASKVCPSMTLPKTEWLPCLLCDEKGHCVTSCPSFQPKLVMMELSARKPDFQTKPADFPALKAASRHQPASVAAEPNPKTTSAPSVSKPTGADSFVNAAKKSPKSKTNPTPENNRAASSKPTPARGNGAAAQAPSANSIHPEQMQQLLTTIHALQLEIRQLRDDNDKLHLKMDQLSRSPAEEEELALGEEPTELDEPESEEKSNGPVQPASASSHSVGKHL